MKGAIMSICVFTDKEKVLINIFPKNTQFLGMKKLPTSLPQDTEITYIDVTGLSESNLKKILVQIKKICKDIPWGIIDPKGNINDPASIFFEGASDYIGQAFLKTTDCLNIKRIKSALSWRTNTADSGKAVSGNTDNAKEKEAVGFYKSKIKLPPAGTFTSWKKTAAGKTMPFYLLYCTLQGKTSLENRLDEKAVIQVNKRFSDYLENIFGHEEGLLWMDSGKDCLFLFPPKANCAEYAVENCIRAIISAPLITVETLGLTFPVNFIFALHYGSITYKPPGKTGTVVSDAVNAVFHLGAKKSEPGRLTLTTDVPNGSIPKSLQDCFVPAGDYEGRDIWQSRKFVYEKPWV